MGIQGKGFFIWKIWDCAGGSPEGIAAAAREAGLTHILIKIADGSYPYNLHKTTRADLIPPVVEALRQQGTQVWGWHYVYGYDPAAEARTAIQRLKELGLDGYVIDAEVEYKEPGRARAAQRFMGDLRSAFPDLPVALSSYRFPTYHPQLPWRSFLEHCNYNMPQVYWEQAHNPAAQLARTLREFSALEPYRPVIPTGPSYKWNGWRPTDEDLREFISAVQAANLPAVNFFSWDECERDLKNLWRLIAESDFGEPPPLPPKDLPEQLIEAYNSHNPQAVTALYLPDAVQITAARTIKGSQFLRLWYETFLVQQLPGAAFTLTGSSGSGSSRHFTWKAVSPDGKTTSGSDTLGLAEEKISYHYTSYTLPI